MYPRSDPYGRPHVAAYGDGYDRCYFGYVGQHLVLVLGTTSLVYHGASYQK